MSRSPSSLKVLHVSHSDIAGGAAIGMYDLHQALLRAGCTSRVLVRHKLTDDETVLGPPTYAKRLASRLRPLIDHTVTALLHTLHTDDFAVNRIPDRTVEQWSQDFDFVHLHWLGGATVSIRSLLRLQRPIVWSLRDMWPFTGGCWYAKECTRYATGCGHCPLLRFPHRRDVSMRQYELKQRLFQTRDVTPVALSHWMKEQFTNSRIAPEKTPRVIPNAIDTAVFQPARDTARAALRLQDSTVLLVFGGFHARRDPRKGFALLQLAMESPAVQQLKHVELLIFGETADFPTRIGTIPVRNFGQLPHGSQVAQLYQAADITVVPSLFESFGKTAAEAMACGSPVVSFDTSGLRDIVQHGVTGYRAKCYETEQLGRFIHELVLDPHKRVSFSKAAVTYARRYYSYAEVADAHLNLYHDILSRRASTGFQREGHSVSKT